jgi:Tfp pilus assembly protein PilF
LPELGRAADQRRLRAAEGYLELGMPLEANDELEEITPEHRAQPQVLGLRVGVYLLAGHWALAATVARHLAKEIEPANPQWWIQWAYAARRAESVAAAETILLAAEPQHNAVAIVQFNLACYAAQLGRLTQARARLARAIDLDAQCKLLALEEPDLEPIR